MEKIDTIRCLKTKKAILKEYKNLPGEEKNKEREYGKNRYHKMPEEKEARLKKYQKNYYQAKKSQYNE